MLRRFTQRPVSLFAATFTGSLSAEQRFQSAPARRPLHAFDSYLSGTSAAYIEEMYLRFKKDRSAVDACWQEIFDSSDVANFEVSILKQPIRVISDGEGNTTDVGSSVSQSLADCARLTWMILAFEERGHLCAQTDPLSLSDELHAERAPTRKYRPLSLELESFGFTPAEFDRVVKVGFQAEAGGILDTSTPPMTIRQLHDRLKRIYCGNVGYEFSHIADDAQSRFLRENIESERDSADPLHRAMSNQDKLHILDRLGSAVFFEDYFFRKHNSQKRFGLDGGESLVLGLSSLINRAADHGVGEVVLGMAHRGRLNILHHICGKPFEVIFKEFLGVEADELKPFKLQSDVKYHLGFGSSSKTRNGKDVYVEMLPNPSHLEAVNPVVQGKARAAQFHHGAEGQKRVLPIELHGDAAFSGQGVVFETMCISEVGGYHTGGTIHVVTNNQIGFTTDPKCSRSSAYCTDLGRTFQCPIFHVNGDCPEEVVRVFELAANFRNQFGKSVVIDLVCYRRNGHNESDDATMTQPLMYKLIKNTPHIFNRYGATLVKDGVITEDALKAKAQSFKTHYNETAKKVENVKYADVLRGNIPDRWKNTAYSDATGEVNPNTAVTVQQLEPVIKALNTLPEGFAVHPKIKAIIDRRTKGLAGGAEGIDWGAAEALALGTLMQEGYHVRISGQDVERATFSQRHAVLHDQKTNQTYTQLANISPTQAPLTITNSPLSEYGVLGFDMGYALYDPKQFVMWEAQFGDFANGATIIFDQFLSAGESKWNQQQAVVVSLPHGYDGNGPEHSSGRLERFLQSVSEDVETPALSINERHHQCNWEVTFPSTPAQYFHLIRRHVGRNFRKPWVNFFSKQFLRAPNLSTVEELTSGTFQPVIADLSVPASKARRVVLCTGQIYHILNKHRNDTKNTDVALVRVEQLAPFPVAEVQSLLKEYDGVELMWAQEEPKNMGAFWHVEARVEAYTNGSRTLKYNGRAVSASPSTGFKYVHEYEQNEIKRAAFE